MEMISSIIVRFSSIIVMFDNIHYIETSALVNYIQFSGQLSIS